MYRMTPPSYIFHNSDQGREQARLRLIERYHDARTRQRLRRIGLSPTGQYLEIGPGAGSIMRWMARTVRPHGQVTAVELNPRFIAPATLPNLSLIHGDISRVPLSSKTFHLAHARFTFIHIRKAKLTLTRIVQALRPGGWLVLEEPDFTIARISAGPKRWIRSVQRVNNAIECMFVNAGLDPSFGHTLPALLQGMGLTNLTVEHDAPLVRGGSPMATIMKWSALQLTQHYLATGQATKNDLKRYACFTDDPQCWAIYHATVAVLAQKPQTRSGQT